MWLMEVDKNKMEEWKRKAYLGKKTFSKAHLYISSSV